MVPSRPRVGGWNHSSRILIYRFRKVTLGIEKPTDAERIFQALAQNGTVQVPIQETFWATRFGMLVDQFGIPWMINCEKAA